MGGNNNSNNELPETPELPGILPASNAQGMANDLLAHAVPAIIDTSTASDTTNLYTPQKDASMRNRIGAWYHNNDSYTSLCNNLEM